ncbi:hypothetical protein HKD21_04535 [Gluconobacter cerevisiae]|uniref:Uncharacterized protein n=1 Tax=Gluconobacter cerevisiae TaxID=1379734 RepID=A0ABR9YC18_9PROT|nr:hypothetical protein [Gluconobacter cerevisiae]MBF0876116.1 hypothetical protein [Gluconobacter cerevisiae]
MLVYCIVALTFVIWGTIYFLYFRVQLRDWFGNRFGRDSDAKIEETLPDEPRMSLTYTSNSEDSRQR